MESHSVSNPNACRNRSRKLGEGTPCRALFCSVCLGGRVLLHQLSGTQRLVMVESQMNAAALTTQKKQDRSSGGPQRPSPRPSSRSSYHDTLFRRRVHRL